jgi:hypothetical protein
LVDSFHKKLGFLFYISSLQGYSLFIQNKYAVIYYNGVDLVLDELLKLGWSWQWSHTVGLFGGLTLGGFRIEFLSITAFGRSWETLEANVVFRAAFGVGQQSSGTAL